MAAVTHMAAALIDWSALGKILLAALIGGVGVVIAFGFILLGVNRASTAERRGRRVAHRIAAGICGACCVAAVATGIYAMTQKPAAKPVPHPQHAAAQIRGA